MLVSNVGMHCAGRRESNDFLLPATITFLNDREWRLRAGFFQHIACLAVNAGTAGLDAFLFPCLEQARIGVAIII